MPDLSDHYPVWREIGYADGDDTAYAEIKVCGICVPKHSHFRSRAEVPDWPWHRTEPPHTTAVLSNRQTED